MGRFLKGFLSVMLLLGLLAMCAAVLVAGVLGVKGYCLYKESIEQTPLKQRIEAIQSDEHFIKYQDLPQTYIDAVISVEDHRFYQHYGLDFIAIGRAVLYNIKEGSFVQGGSTITQQVAKNLLFTQEKKLERKAAEVFAVWDLESHYSKEEIFELYVNTIYFGSGYYGIYDAAMGYYQKKPQQLTDYECVMLAGLPNAPSAYSLDQEPELAKQRMKQVLRRMVSNKVLTQEQADALLAQ